MTVMRTLVFLVLFAGIGSGCGDGSGGAGSGGDAGGDGGSGGIAGGVIASVTDGRIRVRHGESVAVTVEVERMGSAAGPVDVGVSGLPSGVNTQPLQLDAGDTSGLLMVTAELTAEQTGPLDVTVTATVVGDETVSGSTTVPLYVAGAPGTLDLSFSFDGVATYKVVPGQYDSATDIALDSEGRILVVGGAEGPLPALRIGWAVRFNPDSTIDATFGEDGEVMGFAKGEDPESVARRVVVRDGDEPLVEARSFGGADPSTQYLRALTTDGATDSGYGTDGDANIANPGSIVQRGTGTIAYSLDTIVALDASGAPDPTFAFSPLASTIILVAVPDSQGRIVIGTGTSTDRFTIARLLQDGALDSSFGVEGLLTVPVPSSDDQPSVHDIFLLSDGGGVAVAQSNFGDLSEFRPVLIRFRADGTLDPSFGTGGVSRILALDQKGFATHVLVQDDGRIAAFGGVSQSVLEFDPQVRRYNPDGSPDTSFGTNGVLLIDRIPRGVVHDAEGERAIVLSTQDSEEGGIWLARIWL